MLRDSLLALSRQRWVFDFIRGNGLARRMASRFVAGETIETACDAVEELNGLGITATLDLLGESVTRPEEARATMQEYLDLLDAIDARGLESTVSVKLTALGQDIDDTLCVDLVSRIIEKAAGYDSFVRLDMESSAYTDRTLQLFEEHLHPVWSEEVGIVLQSALRRTLDDVRRANAQGACVRLCKGAYLEPPEVAFERKVDVDRTYVEAMELLLADGNYPGIATHDVAIIEATKQYAVEHQITPDRFEFQMLNGVRRDLQQQLVDEGWRVRVYVPYGTQWYPYMMRRLAERPANITFMLGNIMKEIIPGTPPSTAAPSHERRSRAHENNRRPPTPPHGTAVPTANDYAAPDEGTDPDSGDGATIDRADTAR